MAHAERIVETSRDPELHQTLLYFQGLHAFHDGDLGRAAVLLNRAREAVFPHGIWWLRHRVLDALGNVYSATGRHREAFVGFSPYAPSKFIKQFIQAKHAAAVVGTETTIVETLAIEVAKSFLKDLLDGQSAGDALLRIRRVLLAKGNPLGLMYTLYGSSRLRLVKAKSDGTTQKP